MAAQHKPEIKVEDSHAEDNRFFVELSNLGEGRANNLRLKGLLYYKNGQNYSTSFSNQVLGFVIVPKESTLERFGKSELFIGEREAVNTNTGNDMYENSIDSRENNIVFSSDPKLEIKSVSPVMDVDFSKAVDQMIEKWDVETIGCDFYLIYDDVIGQEFPVRVKSVKGIDVEKGMEIESAIEAGEEIDEPVSTLVPEKAKPEDVRLAEERLVQ